MGNSIRITASRPLSPHILFIWCLSVFSFPVFRCGRRIDDSLVAVYHRVQPPLKESTQCTQARLTSQTMAACRYQIQVMQHLYWQLGEIGFLMEPGPRGLGEEYYSMIIARFSPPCASYGSRAHQGSIPLHTRTIVHECHIRLTKTQYSFHQKRAS